MSFSVAVGEFQVESYTVFNWVFKKCLKLLKWVLVIWMTDIKSVAKSPDAFLHGCLCLTQLTLKNKLKD